MNLAHAHHIITWLPVAGAARVEIRRGVPEIKELQEFVGGYVEHLYVRDGHLIVNETASDDMPLNLRATRLWHRSEPLVHSAIVGPAVVIERAA